MGHTSEFRRQYGGSTAAVLRQYCGSTAAVPRQYGGSTAAVLRQYRGSTAAVRRQYSENTFIRLLVQFFHNFDESHIDLSMKYMIREIDKIVNKLIQYDSYTSLNQ